MLARREAENAKLRAMIDAMKAERDKLDDRIAMAEALLDPTADLDQDGDTSLLEAFLAAQARTGEFYKTEGRLASEHALIERGFLRVQHAPHPRGTRVAAGARVEVDGRQIAAERPVHLVLHKPVGYVTTMRDPRGRPTVADLIDESERVVPVGRLDAMTSGLLIMTNDGELAHLLAHPRHGVAD